MTYDPIRLPGGDVFFNGEKIEIDDAVYGIAARSVEAAFDGIITVDADGIIQHLNSQAASLLGGELDDFIGKSINIVMPESHAKRHDGYIKRYMETGLGRVMGGRREVPIKRLDGRVVPVELTLIETYAHGQRLFVGYLRSLERQHREMQALRLQDMRLQLAQRFASVGTWDWNVQTGDLYWSEQIAELFGYRPTELATTYANFMAAVHPDDRKLVSDAVTACIEHDRKYEIEHRVVWPDGTVRWLQEQGGVLRDRDGTALRMMGVVHDVSVRKRAELRLIQAKMEAQAANQAKSTFISSMSHELRTPLTAIIGFSELMLLDHDEGIDPLSDPQHEGLEHVLHGGQHLLGLVNDVLDLAKIQSGNIDLQMGAVDVADLVGQCARLSGNMADAAQVLVHLDFDTQQPRWVQADGRRLRQIILNLLSNGIKYNQPGGSVRLCVEGGAQRVRVVVEDTGQGIPKARQAEVFTPFKRLGQEAGCIEGTGIGLSISRELAERMGAVLSFESEEGEGARFWLDLQPADGRTPAIEAERTFGTAHRALSEKMGGRALDVLHVEDGEPAIVLLKGLLERHLGMTVRSARSVSSAMQELERKVPDLVILDIRLGDESGFRVLRALRSDPRTQQVPVMALSAGASAEEVQAGIDAQFDAYLSKPLKVPELLDCLAEVLGP